MLFLKILLMFCVLLQVVLLRGNGVTDFYDKGNFALEVEVTAERTHCFELFASFVFDRTLVNIDGTLFSNFAKI